jgi:hypothetical protein
MERRRLRRDRDGGGRDSGFPLHALGARGLAERAPDRHRALSRPLDPPVGIEAGFTRELSRAHLIGVGSCH